MTCIIKIHPIGRLYNGALPIPWNMADYALIGMVQATMPDWHISWFGRSTTLWFGREIFYIRMSHSIEGLVPSVVTMEFLFEIDTAPSHSALATVIASRKDGGPGWVLTEGGLQHYPVNESIQLQLDLALGLPHSED
jgi:hypothetical protein